MGMSLKIVFNRLPDIINAMDGKAGQAVEQAAQAVVEAIQQRAPVDTGKLRDGYHYVRTGPAEAEVRSGDDVDYAVYQEYGTRYQPGTPHFQPGFDASRDALANAVRAVRLLEP